MASQRRRTPPEPVSYFRGKVDGVRGNIAIFQPVRQSRHEWIARLKMTGAFREDIDLHGSTKKQVVALALGLCHFHVGGRHLVDGRGATVRVPGKPLPRPPDVDDGARAEEGVCACLVDEGDGHIRIVLDDVTRNGRSWTVRTFYTHHRYPKDALLGLAITEKDFSKLGAAVMTRLVAGAFRQGRLGKGGHHE